LPPPPIAVPNRYRSRDGAHAIATIHRNKGGYTVQVWSDRNPQGFSYRTFGKGTAELTDFEGMCLVRRVPRKRAPAGEDGEEPGD
jgi:hypothetical protein